MYAGIDLIDPGGHRLVRLGRFLRDVDDAVPWYDQETIGPTVWFGYEADDPNDPDRWTVLWFACKTCRDQGLPPESSIDYTTVEAAVTALWERCLASEDTPRQERLHTATWEEPPV